MSPHQEGWYGFPHAVKSFGDNIDIAERVGMGLAASLMTALQRTVYKSPFPFATYAKSLPSARMSSYEGGCVFDPILLGVSTDNSTADHNIPSFNTQQQPSQHRRPDLTTFFSTLELIDTSGSSGRSHNNPNALPIPSNVSAAYRQLANSYQVMLGETEGVYVPEGQERGRNSNEWLESMIAQLMQNANNPPERPQGLPNTFFDGERSRALITTRKFPNYISQSWIESQESPLDKATHVQSALFHS